jgi:hypothetical protein
MDLRPYHDGLGQEGSYDNQLDALKITYEDWEEGFGSPYSIARTNKIFLFAQTETPTFDHLSQLSTYINDPPVLVADSVYIYQTSALGRCWSPAATDKGETSKQHQDSAASGNYFDADSLENNLYFLFNYYQNQISQRRWYGFWDDGDIMQTYDEDRHCWRYDVGGYAWDNSELSPDLWLLAVLPSHRAPRRVPRGRGPDEAHGRGGRVPPGAVCRVGHAPRRAALER